MSYSCIWDGFDDYNTTGERWDSVAGTIQYSSAYARFAPPPNCVGQGLRLSSGGLKTKNFTANVNRPMASFAFMFETLPSASNQTFMGFGDNGNGQVVLFVSSTGALGVSRGYSFGTQLALTAPGFIAAGAWYFCDFDAVIHPSAGSVKIYISTPAGGAAVISLTSVNTSNSGNAWANQVSIGYITGGTSAQAIRFDDFHCHDASGGAPNTLLGEGTRIYTKMPSGVGYATTLTPNGAAANWQCVDECPPDGDTTYVSAASFPLTEGYAVGSAGLTGTVNGIVRTSYIRKDDAGVHSFQNGVRSGTTNSLSSPVAVNSTYTWWQAFFGTDPNTSAAWTVTGADAASPIISAVS